MLNGQGATSAKLKRQEIVFLVWAIGTEQTLRTFDLEKIALLLLPSVALDVGVWRNLMS